MVIRKTRVRNVHRYLVGIPDGGSFTFGVRVTPGIRDRLRSLGFSASWVEGEALLPPADVGPSCRRNAEGWNIVHQDLPMETAFREFEWTWTEYHGPYEYEQSKIVYQPYQRYPRTPVAPPALEVCTASTPQGRMVVLAQVFRKGADLDDAKLGANLLLELFGEVEILRGNLASFVPAEVRRVNWEVLPQGEHPWATLKPAVLDVLEAQGERKRPVFEHRWSTISGYAPDFVAVGRAGFSGYLVFGFSDRSLFILESAYYGNATYVLARIRHSAGELALSHGL